MVVLTGSNLGSRQRELNIKVNEAAANGVDFDKVKAETGKSDIDNIFKIDLASKYRNIEYILEVLKSGDSLYISRGVKCIWLYDNEFANIINPNYLHHNIFPYMSIKMKKKLLSTLSTYMRDEKRSEDFYTYCMDSKLSNFALKFLIFTSESFKIQVITEDSKPLRTIKEREYLRQFIGYSFSLADAYLKAFMKKYTLYELRYLYSVSDVKYLELIQKYEDNIESQSHWRRRLGLRISRDFMKTHKSRIFEYPLLYLNIINKNILAKYTTSDDAKLYAVVLLPDQHFWGGNYYQTHKHILDKIPFEERLQFIKKIFTEKYPDEEFEMNSEFYTLGYYNLMTIEEREAWALRHINSGAEILGSGEDYMWYKFVNFERAFVDIKRYIMVTQDSNKRLEIIKILIESARNQMDLEKLLNYYYERHINEARYAKECFIRSINDHHKVIEFNDNCWKLLNKILYSLDVYNSGYGYFVDKFRAISLVYYILNKNVPDILNQFIDTEAIKINYLKVTYQQLSEERKEMVFQYMLQFYERKMKSFDKETYDKDLKEKARPYIYSVLDFLSEFDKTSDSTPEVFMKYIKLDWDSFKDHHLFKVNNDSMRNIIKLKTITQDNLIRYMKQDAKLIVDKLPLIKENMEKTFFKLNRLLSKLNVYFSDDIAKEYFEFYKKLLLAPGLKHYVAKAAVYAIYQLADDNFKIDFMITHIPTDSKIDHTNICRNRLQIQKAICAYACKSRPPVPLANVLPYIKGDYVHSCLPMFNSYMANLPLPLCMKFIESIIDSPLSVQKHGIRLAFHCFNIENLKKLLSDIWNKTKNVSLRVIIYKAVLNQISKEHEREQKELFELIKTFTLDLNLDDDKELYALVTRNKLPDHFVGEHLECVWNAISKLPQKSGNIKRMCKVLNCMEQRINSVPKGVLQSIIDDHVKNMFNEKQILNTKLTRDVEMLINAKWELTITNLVHVSTSDQLEKNLEVVNFVMKKCLEMWNEVRNKTYIIKKFCLEFIKNLESKSYHLFFDSYANLNVIFKSILRDLEHTLSSYEIYMLVWNLHVSILTREVVISAKQKLSEEKSNSIQILEETSIMFSKKLRNLLNEFIEKRLLYTFFFPDIVDEITAKLLSLIRCLHEFREQEFLLDDIFVLMSNTLIEIEIPQMYMFAVLVLPKDHNKRFSDVYLNVLKKVNAFENGEVQCFLKQKFLNDFTWRSFI